MEKILSERNLINIDQLWINERWIINSNKIIDLNNIMPLKQIIELIGVIRARIGSIWFYNYKMKIG